MNKLTKPASMMRSLVLWDVGQLEVREVPQPQAGRYLKLGHN